MSKLTSLAAIVLAIALSGSAYSAPGRGGGGGHGGAPHVGGGGMRGGGGAHFGGAVRHFGGGGVRHFSGGERHFVAYRSTAGAISRGGSMTAINGNRTFSSS